MVRVVMIMAMVVYGDDGVWEGDDDIW